MALGYRGAGIAQGLSQGLPLAFNTYYQNKERQRQEEEAEHKKRMRPLDIAERQVGIASKAAGSPETIQMLRDLYPGGEGAAGDIASDVGLGGLFRPGAQTAMTEATRQGYLGRRRGLVPLAQGIRDRRSQAATEKAALQKLKDDERDMQKVNMRLDALDAREAAAQQSGNITELNNVAAERIKIEAAADTLNTVNRSRKAAYMKATGINEAELTRRLREIISTTGQEEEVE